jgi:hypothetical protein
VRINTRCDSERDANVMLMFWLSQRYLAQRVSSCLGGRGRRDLSEIKDGDAIISLAYRIQEA